MGTSITLIEHNLITYTLQKTETVKVLDGCGVKIVKRGVLLHCMLILVTITVYQS